MTQSPALAPSLPLSHTQTPKGSMLGTSREREPYNLLQTHGFWIDQKGDTRLSSSRKFSLYPHLATSANLCTPLLRLCTYTYIPYSVYVHFRGPKMAVPKSAAATCMIDGRRAPPGIPLPQRQSLPFVNRDTKTAAGAFFCSTPHFSLFSFFLPVRCHRFISLRRLSHRRPPFLLGTLEGEEGGEMEKKESGAGGKAVPLKI